MKVAIVHDDLVQWGGAERVLEGLCEIYPEAHIFTSIFDYSNTLLRKKFADKVVITSFLQKIPAAVSLYKALLPFYPAAFEQFNFDPYDVVISHTTRFAKSIITKPETLHICYCHTPPRFLWHFSNRRNYGFFELLMTKLRIYDQVSANRVDFFFAGSENAKRRIKKVYGADAKVVYPFIDLMRFKNIDTFDGGYFVVAGRRSEYKRFDLAISACKKLGRELKVIKGDLPEELFVSIIAGCKALIVPGIEDFGLIALEAQALGKPVIAYREGGALETVIEGKTGIFFDKQEPESLAEAIKRLDQIEIKPIDCKNNAFGFSKENFIGNFRRSVKDLKYV